MSTTYTQRLALLSITSAGGSGFVTVPPGVLWVVRNMEAVLVDSIQRIGLQGFTVQAASFPVWHLAAPLVDSARSHHYEGRIALYAGEVLGFTGRDSGWTLEATGYVFSSSPERTSSVA